MLIYDVSLLFLTYFLLVDNFLIIIVINFIILYFGAFGKFGDCSKQPAGGLTTVERDAPPDLPLLLRVYATRQMKESGQVIRVRSG